MHIHVGKANCIGYAFDSLSAADLVLSHREALDFDFTDVEILSVSAFDPEKKTRLIEDFWLTQVNVNFKTTVQYISTGRSLMSGSRHHEVYIANKRKEMAVIQSKFENCQIFYVSNVVPINCQYLTGFFKLFVSNFRMGLIDFDVHKDSKWDFIPVSVLISFMREKQSLKGQAEFNGFSMHSFTVSELVDTVSRLGNIRNVSFGSSIQHYTLCQTDKLALATRSEVLESIVNLLESCID